MKKWKGLQQGNVVQVCREHVTDDESCLCEDVSEPMRVGKTISERVTMADSFLREIMELLPLTVDCSGKYVKLLYLFANVNSITDASGQTCSPFEIWQFADWLSSPLCHYCLHCLCNCWRGPGQSKDGYLSITVLPSHPLSSSERCAFLLIFSTCQKLGEQLLGWTATFLILDT